MERTDPEVSPRYRKDESWEHFASRLNDLLAPAHDADLLDLPAGRPIVHVFGVPRSGTTLVVQLLATHLDVGYIDNLAAAFWKAPVYGVRLSRALLGTRRSSFASEFGRTKAIQDPHEFGYFWSERLGYGELAVPPAHRDASVDWPQLARVLRNVAAQFNGPLILKNFLAAWHLESLLRWMPESRFIFVRRDLAATAMSLLRMRDEFLGDRARWASLKPAEYPDLADRTPHEQVAGQAYFLERAIVAKLAGAPPQVSLAVSCEQIQQDPTAFIEGVRTFLGTDGAAVTWRDRDVSLPTHRASARGLDYQLIERAIAELRSAQVT